MPEEASKYTLDTLQDLINSCDGGERARDLCLLDFHLTAAIDHFASAIKVLRDSKVIPTPSGFHEWADESLTVMDQIKRMVGG